MADYGQPAPHNVFVILDDGTVQKIGECDALDLGVRNIAQMFGVDAASVSAALRRFSGSTRITEEQIERFMGEPQRYQRNYMSIVSTTPVTGALHDHIYHLAELKQPESDKRCKIHPNTRSFLEKQRQRQQRKAGKR